MKVAVKAALIVAIGTLLLSACGEDKQPAQAANTSASQPYSKLLVYPVKTPLAEFKLASQDGETFDQSGFYGRWSLVFMGYTNCPDVCPTTLMDLTRIYDHLAPEYQKQFQVIFLSVDPARDTLDHLRDYISYFNEDFIGITGDKSQIDILVKALGGIYAINHEDEKYYSVEHTGRIFIVNPEGERFGIIKSEAMLETDKSALVDELNQLAAN